jgi:hypothetical protein
LISPFFAIMLTQPSVSLLLSLSLSLFLSLSLSLSLHLHQSSSPVLLQKILKKSNCCDKIWKCSAFKNSATFAEP